jgi:hypothetical protein
MNDPEAKLEGVTPGGKGQPQANHPANTHHAAAMRKTHGTVTLLYRTAT